MDNNNKCLDKMIKESLSNKATEITPIDRFTVIKTKIADPVGLKNEMRFIGPDGEVYITWKDIESLK
jgi:hypothetical protein